jgi:hypothetical protein
MPRLLLTLAILYVVSIGIVLVRQLIAYVRMYRHDPDRLCPTHNLLYGMTKKVAIPLQVAYFPFACFLWPLVFVPNLIMNPKFRPWWFRCDECGAAVSEAR